MVCILDASVLLLFMSDGRSLSVRSSYGPMEVGTR